MDKFNHESGNDAATILEAGLVLGDVRYPVHEDDTGVGTPFVVIPMGATIADLSHFLAMPDRIKAHRIFHDPASLIAYVVKFKDDSTIILFNGATNTFTAILDYHASTAEPGWCDHIAEYRVTEGVHNEIRIWIEEVTGIKILAGE